MLSFSFFHAAKYLSNRVFCRGYTRLWECCRISRDLLVKRFANLPTQHLHFVCAQKVHIHSRDCEAMSEVFCEFGVNTSGQCQSSANHFSNSRPRQEPLALLALNHISRTSENVPLSTAFYRDTLGFCVCKRPKALQFEGAW